MITRKQIKCLSLKLTVNLIAVGTILLLGAPTAVAQNKGSAEAASYTGSDRQLRLVEGAKK